MRPLLLFPALFLTLFALEVGLSLHLFAEAQRGNGAFAATEKASKGNFLVPEPEYLKLVSGSFRPLFAHLLYMKGVLEVATSSPEKMDYLFALFRTSLQLNPELVSAAFFGGVVLPQKPAEIREGIVLLKEAMKLNPSEWRFPYWVGFDHFQLEEYKETAEFYRQASLLPGSPTYLKSNLATLFFKALGPDLALTNLQGLKESLTDKSSIELIQERIDWLQNIVLLEQKVGEYVKTVGTLPVDLADLVQKGMLREIPADPYGDGYYLDRSPASGTKEYQVKSRF